MKTLSLKRRGTVEASRRASPASSRLHEDDGPSRLPGDASTSASGYRCQLLMRHPQAARDEPVHIGYSRAVLLLGPVELARRGDWAMVLFCLALPLIGQILLAPSANRRFLVRLLRQGYRAVRTRPGQVSHAEWRLGMQLPRHEPRRQPDEVSRFR
jgi:hypothetical protein